MTANRWIGWGLAGVAVAALGIWQLARPAPVSVLLETVDRGTVEDTVANTRAGTVDACRRARLSPLVGGQVARLSAKEGQKVKEGELLLALWSEDVQARIALDQAEAVAADARAEEACLIAEKAQREAARLSAMHSQGITTEEDYDRAATQAKAQQAGCQAARGSAKVARSRVAVSQAELARTRLKAPFDGVVAEVNAELYEFVTPSPVGVPTPPAVDLIDNSCIYISAPIDEVDATSVAPGMSARVTLDALPGQALPGTVRRVAPYVLDLEKQARTVEVEVTLDTPQALLPGLSADVEVVLAARPGVLRVPTAAVMEGGRVLVYDPESRELSERSFTAGLSNWVHTEVLDGLSEGDQVVTSLEREGTVDGADAVPEIIP
ncbi:MAG: efflux RND transporter periplasmic adaptor subunit [Leptospirillia bacterium]